MREERGRRGETSLACEDDDFVLAKDEERGMKLKACEPQLKRSGFAVHHAVVLLATDDHQCVGVVPCRWVGLEEKFL